MTEPFRDHFSAKAAQYAACRPRYPEELVEFLAGAAPRRGLAWDAGAGSGQMSTLLATRFERVVATDASAEQLAHAEPHPRLEYRRARAEASGLESGTVDLAVSAQAAHWFDLDGYYAEVRRVCVPRAVVALVTYGIGEVDGPAGEVLADFDVRVLAGHWPPERRHVEQGYAALAFPFDEVATPSLTMRARWTLDELAGYVGTWSALRSLVGEQGEAPLSAFRRDLARAWGDPRTRREVRWPMTIRAGRT